MVYTPTSISGIDVSKAATYNRPPTPRTRVDAPGLEPNPAVLPCSFQEKGPVEAAGSRCFFSKDLQTSPTRWDRCEKKKLATTREIGTDNLGHNLEKRAGSSSKRAS